VNLYQVIGYPLFIVAALEILLGLVLLRDNPRKSPVNRSVAAFSFFAAGYAFFAAVAYVRASQGLDFTLASRLTWIGWFVIPAGLQFTFYLDDEKSRKARIVGQVLYPFWLIVFLICLFTDLVEPGDISLVPFIARNGLLENPLRFVGTVLICWIVYENVRLRKKLTGIRKAQLEYFFYGNLIFAGGGAVTTGILQFAGGYGFDPQLGAYFSLPWVALTAYAVTRLRLFDIRLVISRTVALVLLSGVVTGAHILLFRVLEPSLGAVFAILVSMFFIVLLFFGTQFNRKIFAWIRNAIIGDRYVYQEVLRDSIKALATILDLNDLLQYIIDSMIKSLRVNSIGLFLKDTDNQYVLRLGHNVHERISQEGRLNHDVAVWLQERNWVVIREEFETQYTGQEVMPAVAYLKEIGAEAVIPLFFKGQMQGVLTLGLKHSREPYTVGDIELLEALASQAAVAIENAHLFEEAKKSTESFQESESKFRALAQTTTAAIYIHRGDACLYANPVAETLSGYRFDDVAHAGFKDIVHPDFRQMVNELVMSHAEGTYVPVQHEIKIVHKNGDERWVSMTAGLIEYGGESAVIRTLFDITDRKRTEQENARLYDEMEEKVKERTRELEEARRLAESANRAKSEFLSNISHELRTPLNSIIGFSEVMRDGAAGPLSPDQDAYLKDIWESGKHLLRVINNILDLSKIEAGMMELELDSFYLKELLEGSLSLFREKAQKQGITLVADISPDIDLVTADKTKLKQVALNLLANAVKFTPDNGRVCIAASKSGNDVLIEVRDTGIGMTPEDSARLFQPFLQLDNSLTRKYEGTGLGLYLSRKIVELHKGRMWVESAPGKGSRFSFTLPPLAGPQQGQEA